MADKIKFIDIVKQDGVKKAVCQTLGKSNKATITVVAIALCKGIFRPMFTMMDKHQDPESKKYAAFREGVTEAIAAPTYMLCGILASKISPKFLDMKNLKIDNATRKIYDKYIENNTCATDDLFKQYKKARKIVGETTDFVAVCTAALIIIPATCNVLLPHIMKAYEKWQGGKKSDVNQTPFQQEKIILQHNIPQVENKHSINNPMHVYLMSKQSAGMRVGN
jgi:hypothetical protein